MAAKETKLQIVIDAQNRTQGVFNTLKGNLDSIKRSHEGLTDAMKTVGTAGVVAFGGLAFLTKGIIQAGAGFEQTQIAFETMLGSAEVAKKTLSDLSKFAARTPFELVQLEEASKRLLAYGLTAEDLIPTLEMLGNISAGVGTDKLPQLILAFGQVKAVTHLTGMELRQFSEAGVPLLGTLAEQFGKTESEILDMVSAGEIGFPAVQQALSSLTVEGARFGDLMERQSQSLGGMWSNLKDQISLTARAIGTELLPYLKPLVAELITMMQTVGAFVKEHPKFAAGILISALAFTLLAAVMLPIAIALPGLILLFNGLAGAFGLVATAATAMGAPLIATILLLGVIGFTAYKIAAQWEDAWGLITIAVASSANVIKAIFEAVINFIINGVNSLIDKVNKLINKLSSIPFIGDKFKNMKISTLEAVSFDQFDTGSMYNNMMDRPSSKSAGQMILNVTGNTFLDQDSAEKMGDLIMQRLKLSNAI